MRTRLFICHFVTFSIILQQIPDSQGEDGDDLPPRTRRIESLLAQVPTKSAMTSPTRDGETKPKKVLHVAFKENVSLWLISPLIIKYMFQDLEIFELKFLPLIPRNLTETISKHAALDHCAIALTYL